MSNILTKACASLATIGLGVALVAAPALAGPHMGGGGGGFHGGGGGGGFHGGGGGFHGGGGFGGFHGGGGGFHGGNGGFHQNAGGFANNGGGHGDFGGHRGFGGGYGGGYGGYGGGYGGYGYGNDYGYGYGAALGLGLVGGAIIGSQYPYYDSGYGAGYYDQAPQVAYDTVTVPAGGDSQAYCERTFKSYNPATGTYLGYDGARHSCP